MAAAIRSAMQLARPRSAAWATFSLSIMLFCAAAAAQSENQPGDSKPTPAQAAPTAASTAQSKAAPDARPGPGRVLREGSHIVQVRGMVQPLAAGGWWSFAVDSDDPNLAGMTLKLLPGTKLSELHRIVESMPEQQLIFEITGEVFVFRSENYLLISHAPLVGLGPISSADGSPTVGNATDESAPAETQSFAGAAAKNETEIEDDSPAGITRRLSEAVSPLGQSIDTGVGPGEGTLPELAASLVKEGTTLLNRRGRLVRAAGAGGAWSFVFDADASGQSDPSMTLLPCLLLERMENLARGTEAAPALLITGRVLAYHGRNYLLPTSYRIPLERTPITP